jgi:hypothetical protein
MTAAGRPPPPIAGSRGSTDFGHSECGCDEAVQCIVQQRRQVIPAEANDRFVERRLTAPGRPSQSRSSLIDRNRFVMGVSES